MHARDFALTLALATASASAAWSQSIGVFADPQASDCNLVIPYPGPPVTAYVIGTIDGEVEWYITWKFRITGMPEGWGVEAIADPASNVHIGDVFGSGIAMSYPECQPHAPPVLLTLVITPTSAVQNAAVEIVHHVDTLSCGLDGGQCYWTCPGFCGCEGIESHCHCVTAWHSTINGTPCVTGAQSRAWSGVKALFR